MGLFDKKTACAVIQVLAGKGFTTPFFKGEKDAIEEILEVTQQADQVEVATKTIGLLLDRFEKDQRNSDLLVLALSIARTYRPEDGIAQRLVSAVAREGLVGAFPDLPIRLLNRPPSAEEIVSLISAYVANTGSRCSDDEDKLKSLAQAGLPRGEADVQLKRLKRFVIDWESTIDI